MIKNIQGIYNSQEEMSQAINKLKKEGYNAKQITVIADRVAELKKNNKETGVNFVNTNHKEDSFVDRLTNMFVSDPQSGPTGRLIGLGVLIKDAEVHGKDIENGKILILVDAITQPSVAK